MGDAIRLVIDGLERSIEQVMRQLQLRAYQALTSASPVLTGFFRASWAPGTGAFDTGPSERPTDIVAAAAQAAALFSSHQQAANALASGYQLKQGPVHIVNPTSYGPHLAAGSSAQAPSGFIDIGLRQAVDATRRSFSR